MTAAEILAQWASTVKETVIAMVTIERLTQERDEARAEVERLKREQDAMVEEAADELNASLKAALMDEMHDHADTLDMLRDGDGLALNMTAEISAAEARAHQSDCVKLGQFIGDKIDSGRIVQLETEVLSCHAEVANALMAQQQAEAEVERLKADKVQCCGAIASRVKRALALLGSPVPGWVPEDCRIVWQRQAERLCRILNGEKP